jgi:hypothetical protein
MFGGLSVSSLFKKLRACLKQKVFVWNLDTVGGLSRHEEYNGNEEPAPGFRGKL